tara:strand:- start:3161 stop:3811 length:651 start_codon:yes stop_codon:yes gene_type:complete
MADTVRQPVQQPLSITFTNLMKYVSMMSPLLITFFMIMVSIFNNTLIKGLLFTFGLVIVTFINYILKNLLKDKQSQYASPMCNILPQPFTAVANGDIFSSPNLSSTIISFTMAYLLFPMKVNNEINPAVATFLVSLLGINSSVEIHSNCSSIGGVILGIIFGIIAGLLYYSLIVVSGHKDLAYFSEALSNDIKCNKPSKQRFKCVTYYRSSQAPLE